MPRPPRMPPGLGVYIRGLHRDKQGTPAEAARKARAYGVKWVAILACWQDDRTGHVRSNYTNLKPYSEAFTDQGIEVWLWGYPHPQMVRQFSSRILTACEQVDAAGVIIDPELPFKGHPEEAARLRAKLEPELRKASRGAGVTSYGVPSWHREVPWQQFAGWGFGSPQLYKVSDYIVRKSLREWKAMFPRIVISTPAYGPRSGHRLPKYLSAIGEPDAVCVWSWRQLSPAEWRTYRDWSARVL